MKSESKKQTQNTDSSNEKLLLSDAMKSVFIKAIKETYHEGIVDGLIHSGNEKKVIDKILEKYCS